MKALVAMAASLSGHPSGGGAHAKPLRAFSCYFKTVTAVCNGRLTQSYYSNL
eukprot:m.71654 g.71654  ORF g.71654 m.71654 type:complete len:52 (+) comp10076_c0_seq2:2907-3062(+)